MSTVKHPPSNEAELLLYRVLQRANLLQYYDIFISQGGDDVQQLCEAGEEEFLEIMALVDMASKPLHVRRLQKALQEWITNPELFSRPLTPHNPPTPVAAGSIVAGLTGTTPQYPTIIPAIIKPIETNGSDNHLSPQASSWGVKQEHRSITPDSNSPPDVSSGLSLAQPEPFWKAGTSFNGSTTDNDTSRQSLSPAPSTGSDTAVMYQYSKLTIPMLTDKQIESIEEAVDRLCKDLPKYDIRPVKDVHGKKETAIEVMKILDMPDDHPDKIGLMRKYAAIYNRFDSKRKNEGKMSLHEVSVNEAAAQLCMRIPALLTRRHELYPLARRVVRDSGYQYSKGHSRLVKSLAVTRRHDTRSSSAQDLPPAKKSRLDPGKTGTGPDSTSSEARVSEINQELELILQEQDEVKQRMHDARNSGDMVLLDKLRFELEKLVQQQLKMRKELCVLVGGVKKQKLTSSVQLEQSADSHCDSDSGDLQIDLSAWPSDTKVSNPDEQLNSSSLVDLGLKIAQQYGMEDFAAELSTMKGGQPSDSDGGVRNTDSGSDSEDEPHRWNRKVPT